MATYYVSPSGNNANNGLGPDASHASNKPFLTVLKAMQTVASGDTAYIAPGTYRENNLALTASPTAQTSFYADPTNAQGFKDGSGVRLASSDVILTAYATNDTTAPSANSVLSMTKNFLRFENFLFIGGTATNACVSITGKELVFRNCAFNGNAGSNSAPVGITCVVDVANNITFDKCVFFNGSFGAIITLPTSTTADYDATVLFQNCIARGIVSEMVRVNASGANSFKGGGVDVYQCSSLGGVLLRTNSANLSTSIPCTAYYSLCSASLQAGLQANTSGQITEDYNYLNATTARTNVTAGANSIANSAGSIAYANLVEFGQAEIAGRYSRQFGVPSVGSPHLGRVSSGASPTPDTVDFYSRPRPSGGASTSFAWGALERHDSAAQETSTVDAGSSGLKITGPGDQDVQIPVDATSTTIAIKARYDTNHGTGNKPQVQLLAAGEIGFAGQTLTMSAAVDTWETLTFSAFTPSQKGVVTLRLISRSAAGNGIAYFDTLTVT